MPSTEYTINRAMRVTPDLVAAFAELVPQLSPGRAPPSGAELELILGDDRVHLFVARSSDGAIRGAVALVFYRVPTGVRARIEDLVVARSHRGLGLGRALMLYAVQAARDGQAHVLDLTSNPSRTAANALYQQLGFQRWETHVYRWELGPPPDPAATAG
jgi:ribosomal protein S18 acetylase RimI-like enzyme